MRRDEIQIFDDEMKSFGLAEKDLESFVKEVTNWRMQNGGAMMGRGEGLTGWEVAHGLARWLIQSGWAPPNSL